MNPIFHRGDRGAASKPEPAMAQAISSLGDSPAATRSAERHPREQASSHSPWEVFNVVKGRFGILLVALLVLILLAPLIAEEPSLVPLISLSCSAVLVAGLYAAQPSRRVLMFGVSLALADFVVGRLVHASGSKVILAIEVLFWLTSMNYVTATILSSMFSGRRVDLGTLQAGLCVYLLIGLNCTFGLTLVELMVPGSFTMMDGSSLAWGGPVTLSSFMKLLAFSFGTLSSVGSAGLNTATGFSSNLASVEGMIGQIYLAVVVAKLVGSFSEQSLEAK